MPDPKHEDAVMPYNPDENPASVVESVLMQHRHALLGQPSVTGVAVGKKSPTGDDAIVIYLLDNSYRAGLPKALDGIPVVMQVTGPIEAQPR